MSKLLAKVGKFNIIFLKNGDSDLLFKFPAIYLNIKKHLAKIKKTAEKVIKWLKP